MDVTSTGGGAQAPSPSLAAALFEASLGRQVFPVWNIGPDGRCACGHHGAPGPSGGSTCSPGKHPCFAGGLKAASSSASAVVAMWRNNPDANVGIRTGKVSGIFVIDLDVKPDKDGRETLDALIKEHGGDFPPTDKLRMAHTGGAGVHLYFKYPHGRDGFIKSVAGYLGSEKTPGIDVRGDGGYVVAPPSNHASGGSYAWVNEAEAPDAPGWVLDLLYAKKKKGAKKRDKKLVEGGRNAALTSYAGKMRHDGHSENVIRAALLELNREICEPPLSDDEVSKIAASVANYEASDKRDVERDIAEATDGEEWAHLLTRTQATGQPNASTVNVILTLTHDKDLRGVFRYNERACGAYVVKQPPWHTEWHIVPRPAYDSDVGELAARQAQMWGVHTPSSMAFEAMNVVAHRSPYDPVKDYLDGLVWDGAVRSPTWLRDYCQAEDSEHTRLVSARFLISAVARAYRPGCKADQVLVLEGAQGVGKSTVAQVLARQDDWYTDDLDDLGSVKTAERLQGKWFAEIAELAAMNGRDIEVVKAFISRTADNYRGAYLKVAELHPRRCVFIATTNGGKYLNDPSGARRFWVVKVGLCDTDGLRGAVEQLWAEAVVRYKAGERWYSNRDESKLHAEAAEDAQAEDMWATKLSPWLALRKVCRLDEVAHLFDISAKDFRKNQMQLSAVMKRLGWRSRRKEIAGLQHSLWVCESRPATSDELEKFVNKPAPGVSLRVVK